MKVRVEDTAGLILLFSLQKNTVFIRWKIKGLLSMKNPRSSRDYYIICQEKKKVIIVMNNVCKKKLS